MSQSPVPPPSADDLQFEVVETAAAPAAPSDAGAPAPQRMTCVACKRLIATTYFAVAGKAVCPQCAQQINAGPAGHAAARLGKATLFGLGAGLLGAVIWFAIRRIAHMEIGLVAILVGFMVGKAVRKGSGGLGGRGYQILAVVLTYGCIAANYMPDIFEGIMAAREQQQQNVLSAQNNGAGTMPPAAPVGVGQKIIAVAVLVVIVFAACLAAPFLAGTANILGLLIIGFALVQAWKLAAGRKLALTGPYQVGARAVAASPPGVRT